MNTFANANTVFISGNNGALLINPFLPTTCVYRWRIFGEAEVDGVLVFESPTRGNIIVTSPIKYWDQLTDRLITEADQIYTLIGKQADNAFDLALALTFPGAGTAGF